MRPLKISIPESLRTFIDEQVAHGGYGDVSDYLVSLVRQDQKRKGREELEAKLVEGLDSGQPEPMTDEDWADIEQQVRRPPEQRKVI